MGCLHRESVPFATAFDGVQRFIEKRIAHPWWKLDRLLNFSNGEKTITQGLKIVNKFAHEVIATRRQETLEGRQDVLSLFMNLNNDGQPMTENELRDIVLNFMIAGRDTTAVTLSWSCYLLAMNPDIQEKVSKKKKKKKGGLSFILSFFNLFDEKKTVTIPPFLSHFLHQASILQLNEQQKERENHTQKMFVLMHSKNNDRLLKRLKALLVCMEYQTMIKLEN